MLANISVLAIPIGIGLFIAAITLLIDEIYTFASGGKTVLEPFFKWFNEKIDAFSKKFPLISKIVSKTFDGIADLYNTIIGKMDFSTFFKRQLNSIVSIFEDIKKKVQDLTADILEPFNGIASFFGLDNKTSSLAPVSQASSFATSNNVNTTSTNSTTNVHLKVEIQGNANSSTVDKFELAVKNALNNLNGNTI